LQKGLEVLGVPMTATCPITLFGDSTRVHLKSGVSFSTRVADSTDLGALDRLYTENMKPHVERVASWNPDMFRANFEPAAIEVIEVNGRVAGFVKVVPKDGAIYLAELQLGKGYQGRGIGSLILEKLIDYARNKEMLVTLKVIRGNPAEFFYRRYGFRTFETTALHLHMSLLPGRIP